MKRIFLFAAATAVALSSCSKNEVAEMPDSAKNAIGFGTYVGSATKATAETAFVDGDVFAIKAYYTAQKGITATDATLASFMDNQIVTAAVVGDATPTWSYSPIKYWPNNDNDMVSFFAVTDATSTAPATLEVNGTATSFTIAGPATDIMISSVLNAKKQDAAVSFVFQHTMAQLNFTAKLAKALETDSETNDKTTVKVKSLTVDYGTAKIAGDGTFTYDNTKANSGSWGEGVAERADDVFDADATAPSNTGIGTELNETDVTVIGEPLMLLPTTTANEYTVTVVYTVATVDADKDTNNSSIDNTCTFKITPNAMNTKYTYNLEIGLTDVKVTGSFGDWTEATTDTTVTVESSTGILK